MKFLDGFIETLVITNRIAGFLSKPSIIRMKKRILQQIIFWNLLWIAVYQMNRGPDFSTDFILRIASLTPCLVVAIWINTAWFLPRFYFSRQYFWYAIAGIVLIGLLNRITLFLHPALAIESQLRSGIIRSGFLVVPLAISLIGNTLYEVSLFVKGKEQEAKDLLAEKLEAEMKFLKSQINPHFLFNSLNNIYTQALLKKDDAPENLLKLSEILRYVLYDCSAAFVPLRKELDYIKHYVDLFRLKDSGGINIQLDLDESRPDRMVAPLLFVPLIENAFKHSGIEKINQGWVSVKLRSDSSGLFFTVKNSLNKDDQSKDRTGGIGLANVRRQLELIYPKHHEFQVTVENNTFEVELKLFEPNDSMPDRR